jgi:predicted deacylase
MSSSPIATDIDFNRDGKQTGYLRLPHSVHRSAYGWIPFPIACIRNGAGPVIFMSAGVHGDEYEGQIAMSRLIRDIDPKNVRGRIIILPMANFPAGVAGLRVSPLDDVNLNRAFPGDPSGTPTQIIAHYIETALLAGSDLHIDIHSGGSSLFYLPCSMPDWTSNCTLSRERANDLCRLFGAPYQITFDEDKEGRYISAAATRLGITSIGAELGGGGRLTGAYADIAYWGILRILKDMGSYTGSLDKAPPLQKTEVLPVKASQFCYALEGGIVEHVVELGDRIKDGQLVALIHHPETSGREPTPVSAKQGGMVICLRAMGRVERGDCLGHWAGPSA